MVAYGLILSGGVAFGTDVESQGVLVVSSGGILSGGEVASGAYEGGVVRGHSE